MELETIFSTDKKISIGPKDITIRQVTLGDMPKVISIVSKITGTNKKNPDLGSIAKEIVMQDMPNVIALISALTDLSEQDVAKLNLAAATSIFASILKENVDFLNSHVAPMLAEITAAMGQVNQASGSNKSKS